MERKKSLTPPVDLFHWLIALTPRVWVCSTSACKQWTLLHTRRLLDRGLLPAYTALRAQPDQPVILPQGRKGRTFGPSLRARCPILQKGLRRVFKGL